MTPERLEELERSRMAMSEHEADELISEVRRLQALINNPHTDSFLEAVRTEAAHQLERWGPQHDECKSDQDFFWTLGWLAGKAVRPESKEKRLHHIITSAALCLNWHRVAKGGE